MSGLQGCLIVLYPSSELGVFVTPLSSVHLFQVDQYERPTGLFDSTVPPSDLSSVYLSRL